MKKSKEQHLSDMEENNLNPDAINMGEKAPDDHADEELELEAVQSEAQPQIDLEQQLSQAKAKAQEYLDGWQRTQAEFSNYRKRLEREQISQRQNITGAAVKRYLPIVDDLERALNHVPDLCKGSGWVEGIELIFQKMVAALDADGVKPIGEAGEVFDPNFHEAIAQAPSQEYKSGEIIEVVQKGYVIGDKVLRPAIVRVAE